MITVRIDGGPPSQGWKTFLRNHAPDIAAMDLFVVPTIGFELLYGFVIVRIDRRDLVWINVTANPTAEWIARQITEAFPWDGAPGYMIRDRDRIYGAVVTRRLRAMGIRDKPIAPASPWQNGFAERLIGSIRRECLDHAIICGEAHLRRVLKSYADYYNRFRTHRSLKRMHRSLAQCSTPVSFVHAPSWADFITTMAGFEVFGTDRVRSSALNVLQEVLTAIRLSPEMRETVDQWAARQPDMPSRSEAIRRLVELGLKKGK